MTKVAAFAKGPFGIITALALVAVTATLILNSKQTPEPKALSPSPAVKKSIKVIYYKDAKIPLDQLESRTGPDCMESGQEVLHYHAKNHVSSVALDGTVVPDPGACAFGKVTETRIEEIQQ